MPFTLTLPDDLESQLKREAERVGMTEEAIVLKILRAKLGHPAKAMTPEERAAKVKEIYARWEQPNGEAKSDSEEDFFEAMNRSRGSGRLLYPPELKGISW